jgi:hypothetical protein
MNKKIGKFQPKRQKVKKAFFSPHLVALGLDPTAFLKGPEGCPLDHRSVQIRAFQPESDLLSTHIGSWSKVKLAKMTKKRVLQRVLQRVLRYYGGSTLPRCAQGSRVKGQGSRVKGQESRVKGQGSRVQGSRVKCRGSRVKGQELMMKVQG